MKNAQKSFGLNTITNKNDRKMSKKVQQMVFRLANASGEPIATTDNLLVVINGTTTEVKLKDLFTGYQQNSDEIVGWSVFGDKPLLDNKIMVTEGVMINFFNKNTDEEIFISKIKKPFVQLFDKEIDEEATLTILQEEMDKMKVEPIIEENPQLIAEEEPTSEEEEFEEEQPEGEFEEESEEELLAEENEFDSDSAELVSEGYEVLENEEFRLLYKKGGSPEMILCLLVENTYQKVKIQSSEVSEKEIVVEILKNKEGEKESMKFARK